MQTSAQRVAACLGAWLLFVTVAPPHARAESLQDIFHAGNDAYVRNDFKAATAQYQRLIDAGLRDPDVYVNMGLAYARADELGHAILAFERALARRPDDAEADAALALARATLGKRGADRHGEAVVETKPPLAEALVRPYRENTLAGLLLAFDAVLFVSLLAYRRSASEQVRTGLAITAAVAFMCCAAAGSALLVKRGVNREGQAAIILRDGAELREAPDPRASARGYAHEGGRARVLGRDGGFVRVRTAAGAQGWVANADVGTIVD